MHMTKLGSVLFLLGILSITGCNKNTDVLSAADQLTKDVKTIDDYLASKSITAIKDPSGLRYVVTSQGTGAKPSVYSNVNVNYVGKYLDSGASFDKSAKPVTLSLYTVIEGWQIGIPNIAKGSKFTLYIPSGLAYGALGSADGTISANANLIFEVELLDDNPQFQKDIATIDKYLDSLKVTAVKDPSGLRYVVNSAGTGGKPILNSIASYSYTARLLATGANIDSRSVSYYISTITPVGLQTGLQLMQRGSSITFYFPSSLGFGLNSSSSIPPNSNLVYTVQLLDFQ